MAYKIFLSPSNQTGNRYAAGDTNEAVQCGRMAAATAAALERCGFETKTVHLSPMTTKVAEGNRWGADLYVPIHTNAFNGQVRGTRMFSYDLSGAGYRAAQDIFAFLAPLTPGSSDNIQANPGLYEIRYSTAPAVYIEVEFHDSAAGALWIIGNTEAVGEAICQGICRYFGQRYVPPVGPTPELQPIYRVVLRAAPETQLGAFREKSNAEGMLQRLEELGVTWGEIREGRV